MGVPGAPAFTGVGVLMVKSAPLLSVSEPLSARCTEVLLVVAGAADGPSYIAAVP
jgi:hypothetical protein